ncbi:MAG: hypothetical protein LBU32_09170 [Clostridiales bacterium]|jgi:hypothetical protein|nr:hypothetical protein [Clostridiales bacterium]
MPIGVFTDNASVLLGALIFLGRKLIKGKIIRVLDKNEMRMRTKSLLKELGAKIDENELSAI